MLTVSDHSISANSFTADQLSDVAVIWAAAICCRLPDFTPYLLTFTVFFFLPLHIFPDCCRSVSACCHRTRQLMRLVMGAEGSPGLGLCGLSSFFFVFPGEVMKWGWHSVSQGGRQKAEQAFLCLAQPLYNMPLVTVSLWNDDSYRIQFHDAFTT